MASLPIGSDVLLELQTESLRLALTGHSCTSLPGDCFLRISSGEEFIPIFHRTLKEKAEKETSGWVFSHPKCPLLVCGETYVLSVSSDTVELSVVADPPLHPRDFQEGKRISGVLTPTWEAGRVHFSVYGNGHPVLTLCCMLLPGEPVLREAVGPMQEELSRAAYGLTFGGDGHAYRSMLPKGGISEELWSFWCRFRESRVACLTALEEIRTHPHKLLTKIYRLTPADRIQKSDRKTVLSVVSCPGRKLPVPYYELSPDTPENRAVLALLDRTVFRLEKIVSLSHDPDLTRDASEAREELLIYRHGLFPGTEIKPKPLTFFSPVFREARGYRSFYRLQTFLHSFLFPGEGNFLLPVRPLADLYRDWCFVCIHNMLQNDFGFCAKNPFPFEFNGLLLSVSARSGIDYTNPSNGVILSLTYISNRMITLTRFGGRSTTRILFLPDFHFSPGLLSSVPSAEFTEALRHLPSDLPADTLSYGLYLYPGTRQNHRPFRELKAGKPMSLPLLPDWKELLRKALEGLLFQQPSEEGFLPSPLSVDAETAILTADWKKSVLVGALSKPEQLSAAMRYGFYHLPADKLGSEVLSVRRIAIYQSTRLFGVQSGIYLTGEVTGVRRVKRCEIGWLPKKSDEPYLLFKVACWEKLSHPIAPDGEGLVHLLTSPFLLYHSRSVATLRLENETDYRLYLYLERVKNKNCGFIIGSSRIVFTDKEILLFHRGKLSKVYDRTLFAGHPDTVFRRLQEDLKDLKSKAAEGRSQ